MEVRRFSKLDEGFVCENCGKQVSPLGYSSRNHCPYCLHSKHVDNFPGDRQNSCRGIMMPIKADVDSKKGYVILHKCKVCGEEKRNKCARDDNKKLLFKLF